MTTRKSYTDAFKREAVRLAQERDNIAATARDLDIRDSSIVQRKKQLQQTSDNPFPGQGRHFTRPQYIARLLAKQVAVSMDGRGQALDNIFIERLWRTLKYEEVFLPDYETPRQARQGLTPSMAFYNERRPHPSRDYRPPAEVSFGT